MTPSHRTARWFFAAAALALVACPSGPTPRDQDSARIHYDLGVNAEQSGDVRAAVREYEASLFYDKAYEKSENALGILYHLSFRHLDEAERHFKLALQLKPNFSEAQLNLGNLYLDEGRYDEAINLYETVLKDMFYRKPYLAENNEGWAYYKKGDVVRSLSLIQEAVRTNPEFCQGFRNLGLIYRDQQKLDLSLEEFGRMLKKCPQNPEGHYELGTLLLRMNREEEARFHFATCRDLSREGEPLLDTCTALAAGTDAGQAPPPMTGTPL
jgi:tetratricopeptide (TPR) repeat protein